jgi:8-oxo-dGTP diphosphatase
MPANARHLVHVYNKKMNAKSLTIGTVCFLFDEENNKILLLERSRQPMQNLMTGVGGKTDFDEDIYLSCLREIKEETGFVVRSLKFRGVIKTIIDSLDNSWILFIYTARQFSGQQIECPEGRLTWVDRSELLNQNLIGFIREIVPYILAEETIEGTIIHDQSGNVVKSSIRVINQFNEAAPDHFPRRHTR